MDNLYAVDGFCHNAEPGTYGHECGKPATWIGYKASGFAAGFCDDCQKHGSEARAIARWEVRAVEFRYVPMLRPASFATLPRGVAWDYVEAPAMAGLANRPDLPTSRHRYGVVRLDRGLSAQECHDYDLRAVEAV